MNQNTILFILFLSIITDAADINLNTNTNFLLLLLLALSGNDCCRNSCMLPAPRGFPVEVF